ncbi:MAG TPA: cysteine desulfurase [Thermoanaerobaculia bacterium]|nr:cysteine desulfurase [Thermoanaerobaculia bacterium]
MSTVLTTRPAAPALDAARIRADFPILRQRIHGHPLAYLDNAATTQKPRAVLDALQHFYETSNSNVHRGVHLLSQRATEAYEGARERVRRFINAAEDREVIFVRGCTEGINLVANTFGRMRVGEGDEVLISAIEHHSNIVPWQMLCRQAGATLRVIPINDQGELLLDEYQKLLTPRTRLVAVVHLSNSLGTVNPVRRMIELAHERGIPVVVDGAQAVPHTNVDVQALDCDFYAFSGHKMYGPTGIGVLYGKREHLEAMPPWQGGGDMIASVTFEKTVYNEIPFKFEAGTPNVADAVALGTAIDYLAATGMDAIAAHENGLLAYATEQVRAIDRVRLIGTAKEKAAVLSFIIEGIHPHDIGTIVDQEGVAIRTGHHCTQPVMQRFGVPATARASFAMYNTREDIDRLVAALHKAIEVFA